MKIKERLRSAFRGKSAEVQDTVELNKLLDFLGVDRDMDREAMNEAVYVSCIKVLSESVGQLPLKIQQA